jgi:alanyl-tRNA synthetase
MKKFKDYLKEDENLLKDEHSNYMFFKNLKEIKNKIEELLEMNEQLIDKTLNNGHDWANDNISSAAEKITQVLDFMKNHL